MGLTHKIGALTAYCSLSLFEIVTRQLAPVMHSEPFDAIERAARGGGHVFVLDAGDETL